MMVTHSGTNEITNKVETLQKIRKVIKTVKENYQVSIIRLREIRRVSEIILKYNHIFIKNLLKFIFHNTNYIPLDSAQCGQSDSIQIIEEIAKRKKKLVNIN